MLDVSPTKYGHGAATLPAGTRAIADIAAVLAGSLLVALCAQIRIPLPFTPVPITGQTFAVLLLPALLGGWRGPAAVAAYLLQGALGLPFFAGGVAGWAILVGPTGGYLVGFLAAAAIIALVIGQGSAGPGRIVAALAAGNVAIYLFGVPWLDRFVDGGLITAINLGLTPFLIGDAIKLLAAAAVAVVAASARRTAQR
jgi:biotin transport system substrate-specific component